MRLIDADALMDSIKGYRLGKIPKGELEWKIENAPTVDAVALPCNVGSTVYETDGIRIYPPSDQEAHFRCRAYRI